MNEGTEDGTRGHVFPGQRLSASAAAFNIKGLTRPRKRSLLRSTGATALGAAGGILMALTLLMGVVWLTGGMLDQVDRGTPRVHLVLNLIVMFFAVSVFGVGVGIGAATQFLTKRVDGVVPPAVVLSLLILVLAAWGWYDWASADLFCRTSQWLPLAKSNDRAESLCW